METTMTTDTANITDTVAGTARTARTAVPAEGVADWRRVAAATGPAARAAAEEGLRLAYRRAGLAVPERILWAGSPREAVTLTLGSQGLGRSVRDAVRTAPWASQRERDARELGPSGWSAHWAATGGRLWDTTRLLTERITDAVIESLAGDEAAPRTRIRLLLLDAVLGQHDAAWLSAFDTERAPLDGLAAVARNAGWWWPYENAVVICERPAELHRDENGRLDRGDGPALAYPDGFALYSWRGMPVPAEFLAGLSSLTPERIREEENAELRRVMLEHYGYDRYLADSGARPLGRDEAGVLWRIDLPDDEPVVMVEVVNSTAEPDGTFRTYWLRVPPGTRTAREGVAWTFGLAAEAYSPVRET
jgi:hypothetical protein